MIVVVATNEGHADAVAARARALGAGAVRTVAPAPLRRLVLAEMADEWEADRVTAVLRGEGEMAVARPASGPRLEGWRRHTEPVCIGERLCIAFAWSEHDRGGAPGLVELGLGGFGNGAHPTTRLVLEELVARVQGGESVLDVGCGSGVLGLAALRLGAERVVAVDVDPAAVEAAARNAELNGLAGRLVATASLADAVGPFDIVVANIGRAALVELAPQLVARLAPAGWLAASGFAPAQGAQVAGSLRPLAFAVQHDAGEWAVVVLNRPARRDA